MTPAQRKAAYKAKLAEINADGSLSAEQKKIRRAKAADDYYSKGSFDIQEFEDLLGRLEGSKMRQQRQKSVEGRRDIFATGLAGMMSNF